MRYHRTYHIVKTEAEAIDFCHKENSSGSYYKRKNYPATYTPWSSIDGKETGFVCWYVY